MQNALGVALFLLFASTQALSTHHLVAPGRTLKAPAGDQIYRGTDWAGNDIKRIDNVRNPEACRDECNKLGEQCKAYVYRTDTSDCWLKFAVGTPTPCNVCYGRYEFEEEPPASCNATFGEDRFGGDITDGPITCVTQPGVCCKLCQCHPDCVGWVWRRDVAHCWLKHELRPISPCPSCVHG